jgi:hypothetical protein
MAMATGVTGCLPYQYLMPQIDFDFLTHWLDLIDWPGLTGVHDNPGWHDRTIATIKFKTNSYCKKICYLNYYIHQKESDVVHSFICSKWIILESNSNFSYLQPSLLFCGGIQILSTGNLYSCDLKPLFFLIFSQQLAILGVATWFYLAHGTNFLLVTMNFLWINWIDACTLCQLALSSC